LASANEAQSQPDLSPSEEELQLRKEVAEEEKKSKSNATKAKKN